MLTRLYLRRVRATAARRERRAPARRQVETVRIETMGPGGRVGVVAVEVVKGVELDVGVGSVGGADVGAEVG